jgi:catechol 2,3-dioxygenase-like lactoylglutathione lyase family enzyme
MINGAHSIIFSKKADAVRAFFRDVLKLSNVDAGHGWLIFALPPAELAVHPADGAGGQQLYLMCDDIVATRNDLEGKGVKFLRPNHEERWGIVTSFQIPNTEDELYIYQPKHALAHAR